MTMPDEDRVPGSHLEPDDRDLEAPPEDAAEQARPADPGLEVPERHRGNDVNEWDAVEQARVVDVDDDYR